MLSVLVEGLLLTAPSRRTSAKGQPYTVARMRCTADDGEGVLCSVIAFEASAAEALARLDAGDAVAVAGPAALSRWQKDGRHHAGLKVTATKVMSVYDAGMRRRSTGQARKDDEPPDRGRACGPRREPSARQPAPAFDDDGWPV